MKITECNLIHVPNIASTNDFLKQNHHVLPSGTIIQADYQSAGRGQFQRRWDSDAGKNLLFSLLLKSDVDLEALPVLVANSLVRLLKLHDISAIVKSPNDILVGGKKIAGILIETSYQGEFLEAVIIGIGLNVNQVDFPGLVATSMAIEKGRQFHLPQVMSDWLLCFELD